jgi:hypothetical protein
MALSKPPQADIELPPVDAELPPSASNVRDAGLFVAMLAELDRRGEP